MPPLRPHSAAFDRHSAVLAYRRRLPHVVQENVVYFVTLRLFDSLPQAKLSQWRQELELWQRRNPPPHTAEQIEAYAELGYRRMERWLDRGLGSCLLAAPMAQTHLARCLEYRDRADYWLGDYIVMPNHIHALLQVASENCLKQTVQTWRSVTTHRINKELSRRGTLWEHDCFDHIVRNDQSLSRIRQYIQQNGRHLPADRWRAGCGSLFPT